MQQTFYTPQGNHTRDLTLKELKEFATNGNKEAILELAKTEPKNTIEERLLRIEKLLGLI